MTWRCARLAIVLPHLALRHIFASSLLLSHAKMCLESYDIYLNNSWSFNPDEKPLKFPNNAEKGISSSYHTPLSAPLPYQREMFHFESRVESAAPPPPPKKNPILSPPTRKRIPAPPPKLSPKVAITEAKENHNHPEEILRKLDVDLTGSLTKLRAPNKPEIDLATSSSNLTINDNNLSAVDSNTKEKNSSSDIIEGKLSRLSILSFGRSSSTDIVAKEEDEDLPRPPSSLLGDTLSAYHDLGQMPSPPPCRTSGDPITCK